MTDEFAPDGRLAKWLDEEDVEPALQQQTELRRQIDLRDKGVCVGCYLGDASPLLHDYGFGCAYGEGAELN